jgi:hypothetical protein
MEGNLYTEYKCQIKALYAQLIAITDWRHISGGNFNISYCEPYTQIECIVKECTIDQLLQSLGDTSSVTRSQWDHSITVLTRLCIFNDDIELINVNRSLRIQWSRLCPGKNALIVQSTAMHPVYKSAPNATHNDCIYIMRALPPQNVHLLYIGIIDVTTMIQECISSIPRFGTMYASWKCSNCPDLTIPAHELECRRCKIERYKRCPNKRCYEAQMKNATVCTICGNFLTDKEDV